MKIEYRPCKITVRERMKQGTSKAVYEGLFHCWVSEQWTHTPLMRDEVGGQMQNTYGIVELRTGEVEMFSPNQIQFLDSKADEYVFPETNHPIQQAVTVVRDELLKHGDLYDGFRASINSTLKEIPTGMGLYDVAEKILDGLIGEENV